MPCVALTAIYLDICAVCCWCDLYCNNHKSSQIGLFELIAYSFNNKNCWDSWWKDISTGVNKLIVILYPTLSTSPASCKYSFLCLWQVFDSFCHFLSASFLSEAYFSPTLPTANMNTCRDTFSHLHCLARPQSLRNA